jgi:hypothetical protein
MGREIRRVPLDWEHPKYITEELVVHDTGRGLVDFLEAFERNEMKTVERYKPLRDKTYEDALREYNENKALWQNEYENLITKALHENEEYEGPMIYEEYAGDPPDPDFYRPHWNEAEGYCVYETVTEGTPVSPIFENMDSLLSWLIAVDGWSVEGAKRFCEIQWAPSGVIDVS